MPIVEIEIVLRPDEILHDEIVSELAEELGDIFDSPRGGTWVKLRGLPPEHYAENGVYPIFVTIIKSELLPLEEMQEEVQKITGAVAQICGHPSQNVHVIFQPPARGHMAFGGKLVS